MQNVAAMLAAWIRRDTESPELLLIRQRESGWKVTVLMQVSSDRPCWACRHVRPGSAGNSRRVSGPFGDQEGLAPAAVQKLRHAVLTCVVAIMDHHKAASALRPLAKDLAEAAIACLSSPNSPPVHSAAAEVRDLLSPAKMYD